jgi:hypothetical protein
MHRRKSKDIWTLSQVISEGMGWSLRYGWKDWNGVMNFLSAAGLAEK